jgi:hypothetical protein
MSRRDARRVHNCKMPASVGPIPWMTEAGSGRLTVDWAEVARSMGFANGTEVLQFFIDLEMHKG